MPLLILLIETRLMITTRALKVAEPPCMVVLRARSSPSNYGTCHMPHSLSRFAFCACLTHCRVHCTPRTCANWLAAEPSYMWSQLPPSVWVQSSVCKEPQLPLILHFVSAFSTQGRLFFGLLFLSFSCYTLSVNTDLGSLSATPKENAWKVKWTSRQVAEQVPWLISVDKGNQHNSVQLGCSPH